MKMLKLCYFCISFAMNERIVFIVTKAVELEQEG